MSPLCYRYLVDMNIVLLLHDRECGGVQKRHFLDAVVHNSSISIRQLPQSSDVTFTFVSSLSHVGGLSAHYFVDMASAC